MYIAHCTNTHKNLHNILIHTHSRSALTSRHLTTIENSLHLKYTSTMWVCIIDSNDGDASYATLGYCMQHWTSWPNSIHTQYNYGVLLYLLCG